MTIETRTLRPGLLVSLKSNLSGNIRYRSVQLGNETSDDGAESDTWTTTRTIFDVEERKRGVTARSKARDIIRGVCVESQFGLLCAHEKAEQLDQAVSAAQEVAKEFNATAKLSHLTVFVMRGNVAADDVQAVRAINSEIKGLIEAMAQGVDSIDVKQIRAAANKAREMGGMLSEEASERVQGAIKLARDAARKIVKVGEDTAQEVDKVAVRKILEARTMFLDLDDQDEVAAPKATGRVVDLAS